MENIVFFFTAVVCVLFTTMTKYEDSTETCACNDFDKRLKMLEVVEKRYVENRLRQLSFSQSESNEFKIHINVDVKIQGVSICMNEIIHYNGFKSCRNVQNTEITHITIYDHNGRPQIIQAESDKSTFNRRFIIKPSVLFQKIEFFCNNKIPNNETSINFQYNEYYGGVNEFGGRSFSTKLHYGHHIIQNVSKMSIEYNYVHKYFSQKVIDIDSDGTTY